MPSATILSASISRPESVSSSTASFGSSSAICRISLRFFSPPENPTLSARFSMSSLMPMASRLARTSFRNRSEEHTSELQSLMRISYAVFCLKKKKNTTRHEVLTVCEPQRHTFNTVATHHKQERSSSLHRYQIHSHHAVTIPRQHQQRLSSI